MNKLLKKCAKGAYAFSMKNKTMQKYAAKAKREWSRKKFAEYKKMHLQKYEYLTELSMLENETALNVRAVDININRESDIAIGYDFMGIIKENEVDLINREEYVSSLKRILENEDIDMKFAFLEYSHMTSDPTVQYMQENLNMHFFSENEVCVFNCGERKLVVISTRPAEDAEGELLSEDIIKAIAYANNIKADRIIGCMITSNWESSTSLSLAERRQVKMMANLGCNSVICANPYGINMGKNIKRRNKSFADGIISIGSFFGSHEEAVGSSMVIRYKLIENPINNRYYISKGYIPLYVNIKDDIYDEAIRIDYHNSEHRKNEAMMNALRYIENRTSKIRDIRNILTIKDICDILEVELPEKYSYLANTSVGKVCARSFEVNSGDVFFFREPFNDINDGTPAPLEKRMSIVRKARSRGARFIFSYADLEDDIPHINVGEAREAHITVCAELRKMYELKTIGITGSVGKTSTKDMLYNVLNQKYVTKYNLRNSNTQVNIGMHVQDFRGGDEFFIQEIGGGRPGGASRHSRMILPTATVVTNIGHAHIGNYGTQEKLMESKLGIVEGMGPEGTLFLNGDDPLLKTAKVDADTVFYAIDNREADYYADNIREENGKTYFDIIHGDQKIPAVLNVMGHYNVLNAVCSYAIGKKFGLTDEQIVEGIAQFETSGVRQNLVKVAGYNLFLDCFNASPASIDSSLSVLDAMETENKKIAVIGDITGMAEMAEEIHQMVGEIVKQHNMDIVIFFGNDTHVSYEAVKDAGIETYHFTDPAAMEAYIESVMSLNDILLFKGSSKMKLAERVDSMFGTMYADQRYIDEVTVRKTVENGIRYNLYPDYATAMGRKSRTVKNASIKIEKTIKGRPVTNLGDGAFSEEYSINSIKMTKNIRHIGKGCFNGCGDLEEIDLKNVKFIDEEAFCDCSSLSNIIINEGLMHIGREAFKNCHELTSLRLPKSLSQIDDNAFANCEELTIECWDNTYALEYCKENGIRYSIIG